MIEREGLVTYKGKPITLVGEPDCCTKIGSPMPDVRLSISMEEDLNLRSLVGKVVVLNAIPSIDTPVCSKQTSAFFHAIKDLGQDHVRLITVSMDLPFAISRWCDAEGIDGLESTSDYKYQDFGKKFGLLMKGLGLIARSVTVVDRDGILRYQEIVPRMEAEPNYEAALSAVRDALK